MNASKDKKRFIVIAVTLLLAENLVLGLAKYYFASYSPVFFTILDIAFDIFILLFIGKIMLGHFKKSQETMKKLSLILKSARDDALKLSKMKTQFLANMSHEIRTPLNGIIGMTSILEKTELNKKQSTYLQLVKNSGKHLLTIINEILDLSKIEAGKISINKGFFKFRESIEETIDLLSYGIYEKDLEAPIFISSDLDGDFYGDEFRIRQVLTNIIGNAIKFTDKGSISIRALPSEERKDFIEIRIRDTGLGIPASKMDTIFEKFSQADESDTRTFGGTGLGLPISKKLVEAMGGSIKVESKEAVGSEFTIYLPIEKKTELKKHVFEIKSRIQKVAILVKNTEIQENLQEKLNNWGIEVCILKPETLEQNHQFDFIYIDEAYFSSKNSSVSKFIFNLSEEKMCLLVSPNNRYNINLNHLNKVYVISKPIKLLDLANSIKGPTMAVVQTPEVMKIGEHCKLPINDKTLSILIVEDNFTNQMVISATMDSLKYEYKIVENGAEAVEICKSTAFDLILMDCQMPVKDGYSATQEIRADVSSLNHQTPIIAMTANAFKSTKKKCFDSGMNSFVTKPFEEATLVNEIQSLIY